MDGQARGLLLEGNERKLMVDLPVPELKAGSYVYVRVHQSDDALAWSSPIWIR